MSVVVAMKNDDHVLVGCDSQLTCYGSTKLNKIGRYKMWKPDDDKNIVMGVTGALRDANILSITEGWVDESTKLKDSFNLKYVIRDVVPKIFKELESCGRLEIENGIKSTKSNVTFAYKDNAFQVGGDGSVIEMDEFIADGSGYQLCYGAWEALRDRKMPAREKLIKIIEASCEKNVFVNYPIIIMNTRDDHVDIISKL